MKWEAMASGKCWRHRRQKRDVSDAMPMLSRRAIFLVFISLLVSLPFQVSAESTAARDLHSALIQFDALQGSFTQKQYDEQGILLEQSSGRFALMRPGFFRWEILHPDRQVILADPHFLWHHDQDLETVTRRPATTSGQMAPLRILGGDRSALIESFDVGVAAGGGFLLTPKEAEAGFETVTLQFHEGALQRMDVTDALDQRVTIEFFELDSESALTPESFAFTPPPGADLFYYDE